MSLRSRAFSGQEGKGRYPTIVPRQSDSEIVLSSPARILENFRECACWAGTPLWFIMVL